MSERTNALMAEVARLGGGPSRTIALLVTTKLTADGVRYRAHSAGSPAPFLAELFGGIAEDLDAAHPTADAAIEAWAIALLSKSADGWAATAEDKAKIADELAVSSASARAESERNAAGAARIRAMIAPPEANGSDAQVQQPS